MHFYLVEIKHFYVDFATVRKAEEKAVVIKNEHHHLLASESASVLRVLEMLGTWLPHNIKDCFTLVRLSVSSNLN